MTTPRGVEGASAVDYDPFAGAALERVVPTTESQREIWLAAQLETAASLAYNEAITLDLLGALDAAALQRAFDVLVARHEALRASFSADGAELHIAADASMPVVAIDLAHLDETSRARATVDALRRAVEQPFDPASAPLLRVELLRLGAQHHLLVLSTHHLVCDGWSFGVIVRELAALYSADLAGRGATLASADSYADFALAEIAHRQSAEFRGDEDYWLARHTPLPPPLDLPLDRPRPRRRGFASRRIDRVLDADLVDVLKRAGARRGASLFATLLTGFAALVHRLSGHEDIVVGIPAAGQAEGGQNALVGHAVNVLPVRVQVRSDAALADLIAEVRGQLLDAFDHPRYTVGSLLRRLSIERDPSRLPLVALLFNLDPGLDDDTLGFAGLRARFAGVPRSHENFELFVNAVQVGGGIRLECQYATALFDDRTIARWLDLYATLLQSIAAAAGDEPVGRLALLSRAAEAELRALQPAPRTYPVQQRIESLFFEAAARDPQRVAVRFGAQSISYAALAARARAIALALQARGATAGSLVGVMLERTPDMLAGVLGVLASGATYVPLDPGFPRERLAFMARDANLRVLLTDRRHADTIESDVAQTLVLDDVVDDSRAPVAPTDDSDAVAYVIYTSGSTGTPKGVRVPHRAVVNFLASMRREPGLASDDRLLAVTTLSFDIAVLELLLPLTTGACVVLATRAQAGDGHALAELIDAHGITIMQATPATWRLLIESGWRGRDGLVALCGGEALPVDLAEALLARCAAVWNLYGPTETTVWSTCARISAPLATITIGRPIDNTSVWILDRDAQTCAVGVAGEIVVGGAGVTLGYLDRAELTSDRFIADPFNSEPGARLYRTGDRGRWRNDGRLEHLGRLDFQVKLRGYRIELGDIEANLLRHPAIARAVALVREDRPGDQRLVAYLTLHPGVQVDDATLRAHLRAWLPDYMLPQHFVRLDALPQLPNGKLDRSGLPPPFATATPVTSPAEHVAPRTPLEERIAAAMESVLSLPGIGVHDSFFALGGHSLLAAQLTTRLGREFDLALSLGLLFETPTIAGLADTISDRLAAVDSGGLQRIVARADQSRAPLSLLQTRLWLFEQLNPGSVVYNTPSAHRLRGRIDEAAFAAAFDDLVQRQSILRTSIVHDGGELVQRVQAHVTVTLFPAEDLSQIPAAQREAELVRRLETLTDRPIALDQAPLFRVRMFRLDVDEHVLFFMPHHIIWDGWSFDLLYAELAELYAARKQQRAHALAPLPVSYGDFSHWHARWLGGDAYRAQFDRQLARWRERLRAVGAPPPLPTDLPRPAQPRVGRGDTEWLAIPSLLTEAARATGRLADATLFMTLLAVYYVLLWRASGNTQLVVGTPVRVRASAEIEAVMGLFTNLLPVPLEIVADERFVDLVGRVKAVVLDSLASPDVQLEDLMREPGMRELAGATHFYQAQFSYQDARARRRDWDGLDQQQVLLFQRAASEDLAIWFLEHGDGMTGGVLYNAELFEAESARRIASQYVQLLERAVADPQLTVANMSSADDTARDRSVRPADGRLQGRIERVVAAVAARTPQRVAIRTPAAQISYVDLDQRANRLAAVLRARVAHAEALVAIALDEPIARMVAVLAVLKISAVAIVLDSALDDDTLAAAGADFLIGASRPARIDNVVDAVWLDTDAVQIDAASAAAIALDDGDDRPAVACIDASNGVHALSHRDIGAALDDLIERLALGPGDGLTTAAPAQEPLALFASLLALRAGATLVAPSGEQAANALTFAARIDSADVSVAFAPLDTWQSISDDGTRRPGLRHAIAVDHDQASAIGAALEGIAGQGWAALGGACSAIPFLTLQPATTPAHGSSRATRPLAPFDLRVRGEGGESLLPGHVGQVDVTTVDGVFVRAAGQPAAAWSTLADGVHSATRVRLLPAGRIDVLQSGTGAQVARAISPSLPTPTIDAALSIPERWLALQWMELTGVDGVSAEDNFFDLGGHSLLAMTLIAMVEKQTGLRMNLLNLANGSLRSVAAAIPESAIAAGSPKASGFGRRMLKLFGIERKGDEPA